jgi:hypothetical protein
LRGRRDAALLALGFTGAFCHSELVTLIADLVEVPDGLSIVIKRSKTDLEGQGQENAVPRGCWIEPVKLVQAWLQAAGISVLASSMRATFRRAIQLNTWDRCWPPQPSEEGNKIREAPVAR